jgi:Protein of unknown function (DUF2637)
VDVSESTKATRWLAGAALAVVSLFAGIISYNHALDVVRAAGAHPPVAYLVPFLADFVILGASASLLAASRGGLRWPRWDVLALAVGVVVTLAMNVAAAEPRIVPPWLVDAWPPVAFVLALESLAGMVRRGRGSAVPPPAAAAPAACGHTVAADAPQGERVVMAYLHERDCEGVEHPSMRGLGRQFHIHHNTVRKLVTAGLPADPAGALSPSPEQAPRPAALNGSHPLATGGG